MNERKRKKCDMYHLCTELNIYLTVTHLHIMLTPESNNINVTKALKIGTIVNKKLAGSLLLLTLFYMLNLHSAILISLFLNTNLEGGCDSLCFPCNLCALMLLSVS